MLVVLMRPVIFLWVKFELIFKLFNFGGIVPRRIACQCFVRTLPWAWVFFRFITRCNFQLFNFSFSVKLTTSVLCVSKLVQLPLQFIFRKFSVFSFAYFGDVVLLTCFFYAFSFYRICCVPGKKTEFRIGISGYKKSVKLDIFYRSRL